MALACIYFERLCLAGVVTKPNRRLAMAACLAIAYKFNEAVLEGVSKLPALWAFIDQEWQVRGVRSKPSVYVGFIDTVVVENVPYARLEHGMDEVRRKFRPGGLWQISDSLHVFPAPWKRLFE